MLLAVWIVPRRMTRQMPVASLRRLVTAATTLSVTNRSITWKYSCQRGLGLRVGKSALDRHVRILGHPQRVEAALFKGAPSAAGEIEYSVKKIEAPMSSSRCVFASNFGGDRPAPDRRIARHPGAQTGVGRRVE